MTWRELSVQEILKFLCITMNVCYIYGFFEGGAGSERNQVGYLSHRK